MRINLAKSAGFCFGVKRAIAIAFKTIQAKNSVYMLGDIVHNEDVSKQISKAGIKKIKQLANGKNKTLLIRAHGASKNTFENAQQLGYSVINATCPMVKEIHKIATESEQKGYVIIIIGDKKHDEVQGITGQLRNKTIVIDNIDGIDIRKIKKINKAAIVVQSTQNIDKVLKIVHILRKYIKKLRFFNTICRPTIIKQEEIKAMPLNNDIMIIIGSKTSANTRRLYEISNSLNKRSYWIQSKNDIKPEWFRNIKSVGITSGASTPDHVTKDIIEYIKKISS
ncbi:MAG: 4-hydroxy-3-methylbut-2-enyl diphosphate reductase [Candidatus Omnitrophota bacterium]